MTGTNQLLFDNAFLAPKTYAADSTVVMSCTIEMCIETPSLASAEFHRQILMGNRSPDSEPSTPWWW
eukprot:gene36983-45618_t